MVIKRTPAAVGGVVRQLLATRPVIDTALRCYLPAPPPPPPRAPPRPTLFLFLRVCLPRPAPFPPFPPAFPRPAAAGAAAAERPTSQSFDAANRYSSARARSVLAEARTFGRFPYEASGRDAERPRRRPVAPQVLAPSNGTETGRSRAAGARETVGWRRVGGGRETAGAAPLTRGLPPFFCDVVGASAAAAGDPALAAAAAPAATGDAASRAALATLRRMSGDDVVGVALVVGAGAPADVAFDAPADAAAAPAFSLGVPAAAFACGVPAAAFPAPFCAPACGQRRRRTPSHVTSSPPREHSNAHTREATPAPLPPPSHSCNSFLHRDGSCKPRLNMPQWLRGHLGPGLRNHLAAELFGPWRPRRPRLRGPLRSAWLGPDWLCTAARPRCELGRRHLGPARRRRLIHHSPR